MISDPDSMKRAVDSLGISVVRLSLQVFSSNQIFYRLLDFRDLWRELGRDLRRHLLYERLVFHGLSNSAWVTMRAVADLSCLHQPNNCRLVHETAVLVYTLQDSRLLSFLLRLDRLVEIDSDLAEVSTAHLRSNDYIPSCF